MYFEIPNDPNSPMAKVVATVFPEAVAEVFQMDPNDIRKSVGLPKMTDREEAAYHLRRICGK